MVHRVPPRKGNVEVQCGSSRTAAEVLEQGYFSPQHQTSVEEALRALSIEADITRSRENGSGVWVYLISLSSPLLKDGGKYPESSRVKECRERNKFIVHCHLWQPQLCPVRAQLGWLGVQELVALLGRVAGTGHCQQALEEWGSWQGRLPVCEEWGEWMEGEGRAVPCPALCVPAHGFCLPQLCAATFLSATPVSPWCLFSSSFCC